MKIVIEGVSYDLDPDKDVSIDIDRFNEEFIHLPSLLGRYGLLLERAQGELAAAKWDLERVYAQEDHRSREEAKGVNVKLTEKMVENQVITSARYQTCKTESLQKAINVGYMKSVISALRCKQDCLISIGANIRSGALDPTILEHSHKAYNSEEILDTKRATAEQMIAQSREKRRKRGT